MLLGITTFSVLPSRNILENPVRSVRLDWYYEKLDVAY